MSSDGRRSERFPKAARLRKRPEFLTVQNRGEKFQAGPFFTVLALGTPDGREKRLGITVSSKVGNAVTRVRIRRHVREFYRRNRDAFPQGVNLVVIARSSAKDADGKALGAALLALLPKLQRRFAK